MNGTIPERVGRTVARSVFEKRGERYEAHITESELAHIAQGAAEAALALAIETVLGHKAALPDSKLNAAVRAMRAVAAGCSRCHGVPEMWRRDDGTLAVSMCPICAPLRAAIAECAK